MANRRDSTSKIPGVNQLDKIPRSLFRIKKEIKTTGTFANIYPVGYWHVMPGDNFRFRTEIAVRLLPLVVPIFHEIFVTMYIFYMPHRIASLPHEVQVQDIISANLSTSTTDIQSLGEFPTWDFRTTFGDVPFNSSYLRGTLWDYLELPVAFQPAGATGMYQQFMINPLNRQKMSAFPQRMYNAVWYHYFRDPNLMPDQYTDATGNETAIHRAYGVPERILKGSWLRTQAWAKDYFTTALPWRQRFTPAGINGSTSGLAIEPDQNFLSQHINAVQTAPTQGGGVYFEEVHNGMKVVDGINPGLSAIQARQFFSDFANSLSSHGQFTYGFNVNDIRVAITMQHWQEMSARVGTRYIDYLQAFYGVSPNDDRLDRPHFIGSMRQFVTIGEVLQTTPNFNGTPQGTMAGHGLSAADGIIPPFFVTEPGTIMAMLTIMPRLGYSSQGIPREWLNIDNRFDLPIPMFAELSEQEVYTDELFCENLDSPPDRSQMEVFGYTGRYDQFRSSVNGVTGLMRDELAVWHLNRVFLNKPVLGNDFITKGFRTDPFAVQNEDQFMITVFHDIIATRPLPLVSIPGVDKI